MQTVESTLQTYFHQAAPWYKRRAWFPTPWIADNSWYNRTRRPDAGAAFARPHLRLPLLPHATTHLELSSAAATNALAQNRDFRF